MQAVTAEQASKNICLQRAAENMDSMEYTIMFGEDSRRKNLPSLKQEAEILQSLMGRYEISRKEAKYLFSAMFNNKHNDIIINEDFNITPFVFNVDALPENHKLAYICAYTTRIKEKDATETRRVFRINLEGQSKTTLLIISEIHSDVEVTANGESLIYPNRLWKKGFLVC